jgi:hypothetical protein
MFNFSMLRLRKLKHSLVPFIAAVTAEPSAGVNRKIARTSTEYCVFATSSVVLRLNYNGSPPSGSMAITMFAATTNIGRRRIHFGIWAKWRPTNLIRHNALDSNWKKGVRTLAA